MTWLCAPARPGVELPLGFQQPPDRARMGNNGWMDQAVSSTLVCPACGSDELAAVERVVVDYAAQFSRADDGAVRVTYTGEFTIIDEGAEPTGRAVCRSCGSECRHQELVQRSA